jgi:uncharacterized protein YndB with AHSA1/START domain
MSFTKIEIEATIKAECAKVWEYYTNPKHITQWNFAADDWQCPSASNDMRVGGKYEARMEAKDGSFGFDFITIYSAIVENESFTYAMEDGRQATVEFKDKGKETEVKVTFDAEGQNSLEMQKSGWQSILNNFKKYTESH